MIEIRGSVAELARRAGIAEDRAFAGWYAITFFEIDEDEALEAASLDGGKTGESTPSRRRHKRAHPYPVGSLSLESKQSAPKGKMDTLIAAVASLEQPGAFKKAGRPDIAAVVEAIADKIKTFEVLLGLVSLGPRSDQIDRSVVSHNQSPRYSPYKFFLEGSDSILDRYRSFKDDNDSVPNDTI